MSTGKGALYPPERGNSSTCVTQHSLNANEELDERTDGGDGAPSDMMHAIFHLSRGLFGR